MHQNTTIPVPEIRQTKQQNADHRLHTKPKIQKLYSKRTEI